MAFVAYMVFKKSEEVEEKTEEVISWIRLEY